jgi:hypothetical protein
MENNTLDPISAFQKAIAVPRNHVASTFKASWRHEHESLFNSQFNSNMFSTVGSLASGHLTQSMAVSSRLKVGGPSTIRTNRARKGLTTKRSHVVSVLWSIVALLGCAYTGVRLWDVVSLFKKDERIAWLVYRVFIILMEVLYGIATLAFIRLGVTYAPSTQPRQRHVSSLWPMLLILCECMSYFQLLLLCGLAPYAWNAVEVLAPLLSCSVHALLSSTAHAVLMHLLVQTYVHTRGPCLNSICNR